MTDRYYTVLYSIHPLITTELVPIFILITFNVFIYKRVDKAKKRYDARLLIETLAEFCCIAQRRRGTFLASQGALEVLFISVSTDYTIATVDPGGQGYLLKTSLM